VIIYKVFNINSLQKIEKPPRMGGLLTTSRKLLIINGGQKRDRTADAGLSGLPMNLSGLESAEVIETKIVSAVQI